MRVDIVVATYGHTRWKHLAHQRALPSVFDQGDSVMTLHDTERTLAQVRNQAALECSGDMLVFLDADDELAPGYVDAVKEALGTIGPLALAVPRVQYVEGGIEKEPIFPNRQVPMTVMNWCVIGTAVPRWLFNYVGGFREWPCYEDWDLFLRCIEGGAEMVDVPNAIYRAHVQTASRNTAPESIRTETYEQIRRAHALVAE